MRAIYTQPGYTEQDLHDLLATRQFVMAECFTITPLVGDPIRYTSAQRDVIAFPLGEIVQATWFAEGVQVSGLRFNASIGAAVDEQSVDLTYGENLEYQDTHTFSQALRLGRLDGATITRDRYFAATWSDPRTHWIAGSRMFAGYVSTLGDVGRQTATMNVKSSLIQAATQVPRDLFVPECKHTWCDAGCGADRDLFKVNTTVGASSTRTRIYWAGTTDEFVMGKVIIYGEDNVGRERTILRQSTGSYIDLIYPLDFDPVAGQTMVAFPNCRREFARCGLYHADPKENFLGFPHIPVAETAL